MSIVLVFNDCTLKETLDLSIKFEQTSAEMAFDRALATRKMCLLDRPNRFVQFVSPIESLVPMHSGQDAAKLLAKYANRWALMHLKDLRRGALTGIHTGHAPQSDDVPLGTGQVNWPAVLKEAAAAGVKHYFIEDESATPLEAVPKSVTYLQHVKF